MLQINLHGFESPDSTYFRVQSAQPELERTEQGEQVLKLVNGTGTNRSSWGHPGLTSTVVLDTEDVVAIHVGFYHKHGGSQFWRYYRFGAAWQEVSWAQLSDEDRERILIAYEDRAPSFAKVPGKLRADYKKPTMNTRITYKIVKVVDGRYYSLFHSKTEYVIGKRLAERAVSEHGGGYYSYPTPEGPEVLLQQDNLVHPDYLSHMMRLALIECEISGTIVPYDSGKVSSTYLRPLRELKQFDYLIQKAG